MSRLSSSPTFGAAKVHSHVTIFHTTVEYFGSMVNEVTIELWCTTDGNKRWSPRSDSSPSGRESSRISFTSTGPLSAPVPICLVDMASALSTSSLTLSSVGPPPSYFHEEVVRVTPHWDTIVVFLDIEETRERNILFVTIRLDRLSLMSLIVRLRFRLGSIGNTPTIGVKLVLLMVCCWTVLGVGVVRRLGSIFLLKPRFRFRNMVLSFGLYLVTFRLVWSIL